MAVYEAIVKPASGGFGMYDMGEFCECEGVETLEEWLAAVSEAAVLSAHGETVEAAPDVDGRVYNQNGRPIYRMTYADGGTSLHCVSVE